jgi:hypothetical protein
LASIFLSMFLPFSQLNFIHLHQFYSPILKQTKIVAGGWNQIIILRLQVGPSIGPSYPRSIGMNRFIEICAIFSRSQPSVYTARRFFFGQWKSCIHCGDTGHMNRELSGFCNDLFQWSKVIEVGL